MRTHLIIDIFLARQYVDSRNSSMAFDLLLYICQVTRTKHFKVHRILKTWIDYYEDPERSCE